MVPAQGWFKEQDVKGSNEASHGAVSDMHASHVMAGGAMTNPCMSKHVGRMSEPYGGSVSAD